MLRRASAKSKMALFRHHRARLRGSILNLSEPFSTIKRAKPISFHFWEGATHAYICHPLARAPGTPLLANGYKGP